MACLNAHHNPNRRSQIIEHKKKAGNANRDEWVAFQFCTLNGEVLSGTRTLKPGCAATRAAYPAGTPILVYYEPDYHLRLL